MFLDGYKYSFKTFTTGCYVSYVYMMIYIYRTSTHCRYHQITLKITSIWKGLDFQNIEVTQQYLRALMLYEAWLGDSLLVIIQGKNSQRILLTSK